MESYSNKTGNVNDIYFSEIKSGFLFSPETEFPEKLTRMLLLRKVLSGN